MSDKCPRCGSMVIHKRLDGIFRFLCGTQIDTKTPYCATSQSQSCEMACMRTELAALKALVREMAPFVRGAWCEKQKTDGKTVWPAWDKADEILSRPEVRAIVEGE